MAENTKTFGWTTFYREVVRQMLAWPQSERDAKLQKLLKAWIHKDYVNPMPSYVIAEISSPKTFPARAKKAKELAELMGISDWPADFSGVPGTYSGSAFLTTPHPTEELVQADWDLMEAAFTGKVLDSPAKFTEALQKVFDGLQEIGRGKDRIEVTKFVASVDPDELIPMDSNNRTELENNPAFTKKEIEEASHSAEGYINLIKKWHKEYPNEKPLVFNHRAWEKALNLPLTES